MNTKKSTLTPRVRKRVLSRLTSAEAKQLESLTFRQNGMMMYDFRYFRRHKERKAWAYICRDSKTQVLLGWALVYLGYADDDKQPVCMFYVRKNCRQQGIATKISYYIQRDFDKIHFMAHDEASEAFEKSMRKDGIKFV